MFIHRISAISPVEESFFDTGKIRSSIENRLYAVEPVYVDIPPSVLRRMGKAVRISVGSAMQILKGAVPLDGVIIGTANGGMEDSIKFMNQIAQYEEGMLTPGNFVQSTPNGLAAQIAMLLKNKAYNITHTHRGLSFENAVLDVQMLLLDNPLHTYLLGAADEISSYNYNIDYLAGWYKKEIVGNNDLFISNTSGSIAGEGAVMMLVNNKKEGALAELIAIKTIQTADVNEVVECLNSFLHGNLSAGQIPDVLLTGENGDVRFTHFYTACEKLMTPETSVLRFKHITGEFPTANALAVFLSISVINKEVPLILLKKQGQSKRLRTILIYNNYHGLQHSFTLMSGTEPEL